MLKASIVELRRLNTGSRASTASRAPTPPLDWISDGEGGGGVVIGEWPPSMGLAGGDAGKLKALCPAGPWPAAVADVGGNVGLPCSGKKLAIEVVGDSERDPIGEARSDPVDIDNAGLSGS